MMLRHVLMILPILATSSLALAQQYPAKPLRIVVPFAPGGATDVVARLIAPKLTQALGQQVIVDNRPGAGGTLGTEIGVTSKPDGYTFVLVSAGYSVNPSFYRIKFDPVEDVSPVIQIVKGPLLVSAHPSVPVKTVKELIALARSRPEQITYATSGRGSMGHMVGELFQYMAGVRMTLVPYRGTGPAVTDTIAGQTFLNISGITTTLSFVKSGRLKAVAVTSAQRVAEAPDIPTVAESGLPGYEVTSWQGLIAPKQVPRAIVDRINSEIEKAIRQKDVQERFQSSGVSPAGGTPEHFLDEIRKEIALWRKVVAKAGIADH